MDDAKKHQLPQIVVTINRCVTKEKFKKYMEVFKTLECVENVHSMYEYLVKSEMEAKGKDNKLKDIEHNI